MNIGASRRAEAAPMPTDPLVARPSACRRARTRGFTLIEIAIVLVIIGLLGAAVLQGQTLIENARLRAVLSQQQDATTAFLGFQDRFKALPGDYADAVANIRGVTRQGNGNGRIERNTLLTGGSDAAPSAAAEAVLVWEHLSRAGFVGGSFTYNSAVPELPANLFGAFIDLCYDGQFCSAASCALATPSRHTVKTGEAIPAPLLAEIDRKVDDGRAFTGTFRFSRFSARSETFRPGPPGSTNACAGTGGDWIVTGPAVSLNCGAAWFL